MFRPLRDNIQMQIVASLGLILVIQNGVVALVGAARAADAGAERRDDRAAGSAELHRAALRHHRHGRRDRDPASSLPDPDAGSAPRSAPPARTPTPRAWSASTPTASSYLTFAVASALAALGGALLGPLFLIFPQMGDLPLLKALTAIVLGGMGSVAGAVDRRPRDRHRRIGVDAVHSDRLPRHRRVRAPDTRAAGPAVGPVRRARARRGLTCAFRTAPLPRWDCLPCYT